MRKSTPLLLMASVAISAAVSAPASAEFDPAARAKAIAPLLDARVLLVAHVDLSRVGPEQVREVVGKLGVPPGELDAPLGGAEEKRAALLAAGCKDFYAVMSLTHVIPFVACPLEGYGAEAMLVQVVGGGEVVGDIFVVGPQPVQEGLRNMRPAPCPELAKAFEAAGDTAAQAVLFLTPDSRRVIEETAPPVPVDGESVPIGGLVQRMRWAVVSVNPPPEASVELVVQSQDAAGAQALAADLNRIRAAAAASKTLLRDVPALRDVLEQVEAVAEEDRVAVTLDGTALDMLLSEVVGPSLRRTQPEANHAGGDRLPDQ
jgi:hypothetical protein